MTDQAVERAGNHDCATLSDAMDRLGIEGVCRGIKPRDHKFRLVGRAFTVRYVPVDVLAPGNVGDFIDDLPAGTVVVLDNRGREDCTVWGDIMTQLASHKGLAGTVIDGACRDVDLCLRLDYPIYSRSYSMKTGKDRVQVDATGITVEIGGALVRQGDILVGDADGVVVIPSERASEVLDLADEIATAENAIRQAITEGMSLRDARTKFRYHSLQTRRS
ncbi:RraA family protein [Aminobacter carboxidus]|uniref:Putative 4-hydroxy-4-methyl-2-oxoglutarate aldolase n=1 Tax=Aminobacter carboxidus TaxID=376165 RepID=A0ABR9GNL5_9HYPH|nr:RraA family protein [Aminobacter carboxidus]MBE1205189.1 RraA family protein [Aminobacter carboxidus]